MQCSFLHDMFLLVIFIENLYVPTLKSFSIGIYVIENSSGLLCSMSA